MLDFLGIGAQKAGTTWLYEMLRQHPQVLFPAGKEIHFWDRQRGHGAQWYQALFAGAATNRKQGEITPAYAISSVATITEIKRLFPSLRIVYLIRHPIERAWSSACMALARAEMTIEEASDRWFIDHFHSQGSLRRGDYEACIRNWRSVFDTEQILVLRYEDIKSNPRSLLRDCCKHIGVDPAWADAAPQDMLNKKVFAGGREPIRASLLPTLVEIYQPRIISLTRYLDTDFGDWLRS